MNLVDILMQAKKRARLSGNTLTNPEIAGIQQGYFNGQAQLSNQKRAEALREKQAMDQLAFEKKQAQMQMDAAKQAQITGTVGNVVNTGGTILATDYLNKPAGESLVSKGWAGAKNMFSPSQPSFAESTGGAGVSAGAESLVAPEMVEGVGAGLGTESAVGAGAGAGEAAGATAGTTSGTTAGGATLGSVMPIVGAATLAAQIGGNLGQQWGKHSLGLAKRNTAMQFADTLQHPYEISRWGELIEGKEKLTGWKKTAKDVLDPVNTVIDALGGLF